MTETRPLQSTQPATGASVRAPDQRHLQQDTVARFRQALSEPSSGLLDPLNSSVSERGNPNALTRAEAARCHIQTEVFACSARPDPNTRAAADAERRDSNAAAVLSADISDLANTTAANAERRDSNSFGPGMPATVGSLYYSLPFTQGTTEPAVAAGTADATRLIEQATSVLMERASRSDASRFIVSLDHAIVGGASAEFVRDGAFLHVRLLARNDAAYRSMWTHRAELEERLAVSTGLVTRVEILEGYGDGRSA